MDAPVKRVAAMDQPLPYRRTSAHGFASPEKVVKAVRKGWGLRHHMPKLGFDMQDGTLFFSLDQSSRR
jgi:hypothetical protein